MKKEILTSFERCVSLLSETSQILKNMLIENPTNVTNVIALRTAMPLLNDNQPHDANEVLIMLLVSFPREAQLLFEFQRISIKKCLCGIRNRKNITTLHLFITSINTPSTQEQIKFNDLIESNLNQKNGTCVTCNGQIIKNINLNFINENR